MENSSARSPGFIAAGYATRLDSARGELAKAKAAIERLQARYVEETGVKTLKIRTNMVVGYHVEVPSSSREALGSGFTLRQGLASSARFSTAELDTVAAALEDASSRANTAEQVIFSELSAAVMALRDVLTRIAHTAAALDLVSGLA